MNETLNIQNGVSPITIDTEVTEGSMRPVTSDGIYKAIQAGGELPPYTPAHGGCSLLVNSSGDLVWADLTGSVDAYVLSSFIDAAIGAAISSGNEVCLSNEIVDEAAYAYLRGAFGDLGLHNGGCGVVNIDTYVHLAVDFLNQNDHILGFSIRTTQSGYYITGGGVFDLSTKDTIKTILCVRAISPSPIS